jgi:hypothetical protein
MHIFLSARTFLNVVARLHAECGGQAACRMCSLPFRHETGRMRAQVQLVGWVARLSWQARAVKLVGEWEQALVMRMRWQGLRLTETERRVA